MLYRHEMQLKLFCIGPQQGQRLLQSTLLLLWQGHGTRVLQGGERHPGNDIDTATGVYWFCNVLIPVILPVQVQYQF